MQEETRTREAGTDGAGLRAEALVKQAGTSKVTAKSSRHLVILNLDTQAEPPRERPALSTQMKQESRGEG